MISNNHIKSKWLFVIIKTITEMTLITENGSTATSNACVFVNHSIPKAENVGGFLL